MRTNNALKNRSPFIACLLRVSVLACACLAAGPVHCESFDLALVVGRSFWASAAGFARGQTIDVPSATLHVTDAIHCGADTGNGLEFLISISKQPAQPRAGLVVQDCAAPADRVLADKRVDGIARLGVGATASGVLLQVFAAKLAPGAFGTLVEQELGAYQHQIPKLTAAVASGGRDVTIGLALRLIDKELALLATHEGYPHSLSDSDIPRLSARLDTNLTLAVAHDTLTRVATEYLGTQQFPIRGTNYFAHKPTYQGGADRINIKATIENNTNRRNLLASATWTGPKLRLTELTGSASKRLDDALAKAAARVLLQTFSKTPIVPFDIDHPIRFDFAGTAHQLFISTASTTADAKALRVEGSGHVSPLQ